MPKKQLDAAATLIVEGVVLKVEPAGKRTHDHCYGWQPMRALLEVQRQTKGAPAKRVQILYSTRVENKKRCVGGRTSYSLAKGRRYRLHLSCGPTSSVSPAKTKPPRRCSMINWAGVKSLPALPTRRRK